MRASLRFQQVCFTYDTLGAMLVDSLDVAFSPGWSGVVGANGTGKSTILRLAAGLLDPLSGRVIASGKVVYCPQRTDEPPEGLVDLLVSQEPDLCALRGRLELAGDYLTRWDTLSHGQRKRCQIACALVSGAAVLALDEPTNHVDADARRLLSRELRRFDGVGLLVSHDRQLLDALCDRCLFVSGGHAEMRPGGYSAGRQQAADERETAVRARRKVRGALNKLRREQQRRRDKAAGEHRERSKRGLATGDHDARAKIDAARVADSKAGAPMRALGGRVRQAAEALAAARVDKQYSGGLWLPESRSRRARLLALDAGQTPLGPRRMLRYPELVMTPGQRIALTGPNGCGKSTLVRHIVATCSLPAGKLLYMPQEIPVAEGEAIIREVRELSGERLGRLMAMVCRLGSDPDRILATERPSPGETRKLLLALAAVRASHLVIMDEPTNHLDLPSIEALQSALAESLCGLLLVSHDEPFLSTLQCSRWTIEPSGPDVCELAVGI